MRVVLAAIGAGRIVPAPPPSSEPPRAGPPLSPPPSSRGPASVALPSFSPNHTNKVIVSGRNYNFTSKSQSIRITNLPITANSDSTPVVSYELLQLIKLHSLNLNTLKNLPTFNCRTQPVLTSFLPY